MGLIDFIRDEDTGLLMEAPNLQSRKGYALPDPDNEWDDDWIRLAQTSHEYQPEGGDEM